ncbi:MAG: heterodisulfide reductase subunit B, partial [Candidatus Syntrophoarchaeum sp.]|nr:heterodisulfide reductase subunit B [Candidatus Syntrophoarchaeum sp.]
VNYAQLIALAMDVDAYKVVGIQTHSVPIEPILEKVGIL